MKIDQKFVCKIFYKNLIRSLVFKSHETFIQPKHNVARPCSDVAEILLYFLKSIMKVSFSHLLF